MDRKFLRSAFIYGLLGLLLGIVMAASKNHIQLPTHAHLLLLGFVVSVLYGIFHKLWLDYEGTLLSHIQFWLHQLGVIGISLGLFILYGGYTARETIEPLLGGASIISLVAFVLMGWMLVRQAGNSS